jgi:hypothetical protein
LFDHWQLVVRIQGRADPVFHPISYLLNGHTRRFNPSDQCIHRSIEAGELKIQQVDVQTYFLCLSKT